MTLNFWLLQLYIYLTASLHLPGHWGAGVVVVLLVVVVVLLVVVVVLLVVVGRGGAGVL